MIGPKKVLEKVNSVIARHIRRHVYHWLFPLDTVQLANIRIDRFSELIPQIRFLANVATNTLEGRNVTLIQQKPH